MLDIMRSDISASDIGIGKRGLDIDKETVQCVAIVSAAVIVVAAMIFDGAVGDAVGTAILTVSSAFVAYIGGLKRGKEL